MLHEIQSESQSSGYAGGSVIPLHRHLLLLNDKWGQSLKRRSFYWMWTRQQLYMNSMKLVIPLHSWYWSIHTKDESKRGTAFAFIFGVNWLWCCNVTASFGVFFHEIECNGMTSFMEFMIQEQQEGRKNRQATSSPRINSQGILQGASLWPV